MASMGDMNSVEFPDLYTPAPNWTGRDDGPGEEHARWHTVIQPYNSEGGNADDAVRPAVVLGYASDEGVERNGGRKGAASGPGALRDALAGLAIHDDLPRQDAGTVTTQLDDLEESQAELSHRVADIIEAGNLCIVLGGGHETAFASHRGAYQANGRQPLKIVNLDAHFDLREADQPTSGTPFLQIADMVTADHGDGSFDYSVLGISRPNNTRVLFDTAERLGVHVVEDEELVNLSPAQAGELAAELAQQRHEDAPIHLSIDLDVMPADVAPGVSATASLGVSFEKIRAMAIALAATGRLALVDVVELNPRYDVDQQTAKAAARLIADIVAAHATHATQR